MVQVKNSVIGFVIFALLFESSLQQGCSIDINRHISEQAPLLIDPSTRAFVRTTDTRGNINLAANQNLLLACTGVGNFLTVRGQGAHERTATCVSGQTFRVDGINYSFNQFTCSDWPASVQRTAGICLGTRTLVVIGFDVSLAFVPIMHACHDTQRHHTHWTEMNLLRDAAGFQRAAPRPDWQQGQFFQGVDANDLYRRVVQRTTVSTLLGSTALGNQLVSTVNDFFMSRGHLTARADYTFSSQQGATFWFTNASPQWQTFNGGNWNTLEINVRSFVGRLNRDLIMYTGTWGISTLADVSNRQTEIFLSINQGAVRGMPAARYFWKVIRDTQTNTATAFVGMNNPYLTVAEAQRDVFCNDISSSISWLTWSRLNITGGYSFACEISDFRRTVTELPSFTTVGVLR